MGEIKRYDRAASNFVAPDLRPVQPRTVHIDPAEIVTLPPASMTHSEVSGTHVDRAKAFQVASVPVAVAFGVGVLIVAVVGWSIPAISLLGLAVFWVAFLVWWLAAWVMHHIVSPDGLALLHVVLGWGYLRREQAERFKRYREGR